MCKFIATQMLWADRELWLRNNDLPICAGQQHFFFMIGRLKLIIWAMGFVIKTCSRISECVRLIKCPAHYVVIVWYLESYKLYKNNKTRRPQFLLRMITMLYQLIETHRSHYHLLISYQLLGILIGSFFLHYL